MSTSSTLVHPPPFPKIPAYRREADPTHYARDVVCLEKIDGSNTRIGVPRDARRPDQVIVGGRVLLETDPKFCQPILRRSFFGDRAREERLWSLVERLEASLVLYGETCGRGIQATGFIYGAQPHFVLFAATVGGVWLGWSRSTMVPGEGDEDTPRWLPSLREVADQLDLALAPCLYRGAPDAERFDALLDRASEHAASRPDARGDAAHEGIVVWSDPVLLDGAGRLLVAKHKHPNRREALDEGQPASEAASGPASFARRTVTPERVAHARQHLEESGRWGGALEGRAAALVRRVIQDIAREEPEYQLQIARFGKPEVRAALEQAASPLAALAAARS